MVTCRRWFGGTIQVAKEKLRHRPSVYGIIQQDEKILMLTTRQNGRYCLPGGGVEPWETNAAALQREIAEEAGIQIDVGPLVFFQEDFFYYDPSEIAWHGLLFYYHCVPRTFSLHSDDQVDDEAAENPQWVSIDALHEGNLQSQELWLQSFLVKED